jgi:hypothetical protein
VLLAVTLTFVGGWLNDLVALMKATLRIPVRPMLCKSAMQALAFIHGLRHNQTHLFTLYPPCHLLCLQYRQNTTMPILTRGSTFSSQAAYPTTRCSARTLLKATLRLWVSTCTILSKHKLRRPYFCLKGLHAAYQLNRILLSFPCCAYSTARTPQHQSLTHADLP